MNIENINSPKLSIICPSYNHDRYIKVFIESVLSQTETNFELIIIDDFSSDYTVKLIESFNDKRITLIKHNFNQGINSSINDGILSASSEFISIIASDDVLADNYIESILCQFDKGADAVYVTLQHVDDNNNKLEYQTKLPKHLNKYQILEASFYGENQLPSPGMAAKKSVLLQCIPFPLGLFQYSDWHWHNLLLISDIKVALIQEPLIFYRVHNGSASSRSDAVITRESLETDLLMDSFLKVIDIKTLKKIWGQDVVCLDNKDIPFIIAKFALDSNNINKKAWGYKTIIKFISDKNNFERLNKNYGINFSSILALVPTLSIENQIKQKYRKKRKILLILSFSLLMLNIFLLLKVF